MTSVKVVPVVLRALATIPKRLEDYLRNINGGIRVGSTSKNSLAAISNNPPKSP